MSPASLRTAATTLRGCAARADEASAELMALVQSDLNQDAWASDVATSVRDHLFLGPSPITSRLRAAATAMRAQAAQMDKVAYETELAVAAASAAEHAQDPDRGVVPTTPGPLPVGPGPNARPAGTRPAGVA